MIYQELYCTNTDQALYPEELALRFVFDNELDFQDLTRKGRSKAHE